jgi:hypothetical protein
MTTLRNRCVDRLLNSGIIENSHFTGTSSNEAVLVDRLLNSGIIENPIICNHSISSKCSHVDRLLNSGIIENVYNLGD